MTKLDVLDGLDTIRVCVGYKTDAGIAPTPPLLSENFGDCEAGVRRVAGLEGEHGRHYALRGLAGQRPEILERLQSLVGVPITIISTGPDRDQTIIRQNPFD